MTGWWGGEIDDAGIRDAMLAGASQDPWELWRASVAAAMTDPKVIVEIGCDRGGTLMVWRSLCERVYGITLPDEANTYEAGGSGLELDDHGAPIFRGDSHDPAARAWLISQFWHRPGATPVDVLVIDGDHSAAGVRADLADYGPLVRPGGLILLHDIASPPDPARPVEVAPVWPELKIRYLTESIVNPDGGPGWGLIRVQAGDRFDVPRTPARR